MTEEKSTGSPGCDFQLGSPLAMAEEEDDNDWKTAICISINGNYR